MIQGTDASQQQVRLLTMTELEKCIREALYTDNVGCPETVLYEISQATYHDVFMRKVSKAVWSCLKSRAYRWRRIQKALTLLHYLALNGSEVAIREILDHMDEIIALQTAKMLASNPNAAMLIRDKAIVLVSLVCDLEQLKKKRLQAAAMRERFISVGNCNGRLEKSVLHKPVYAVNMQGDQPTAIATGHGRPQPSSSNQFLSTLFRKRTQDAPRPGSGLARLFFGRRGSASVPARSFSHPNNSSTSKPVIDSRDPFPLAQTQSNKNTTSQRAAPVYSSDSSSLSSSDSDTCSSEDDRRRHSSGRRDVKGRRSSRRAAASYSPSVSDSSSLTSYSSVSSVERVATRSSRRHTLQERKSRASRQYSHQEESHSDYSRDDYQSQSRRGSRGYERHGSGTSSSRRRPHQQQPHRYVQEDDYRSEDVLNHGNAANLDYARSNYGYNEDSNYYNDASGNYYAVNNSNNGANTNDSYAYENDYNNDASGFRSRARHPRNVMRMDGRINNVHGHLNASNFQGYASQHSVQEQERLAMAYDLASGPGAHVVANAKLRGFQANSRNVHSAYSVGPSHAGSHPMAAFPSRASVSSRLSHAYSGNGLGMGASPSATDHVIPPSARDNNTVVSSRSSTLNNPFAK